MSTPKVLHEKAMDLRRKSIIHREEYGEAYYQETLREAFKCECQAAELLMIKFEAEPTRSLLFRSAASMALKLNLFDEAEQLAAMGLAGKQTPPQIATELRDILANISFDRHLHLLGQSINADEFQIAFWNGTAVRNGLIGKTELDSRMQALQLLFYRTAQRSSQKPFSKGKLPDNIKIPFGFYYAPPQEVGYCFTVKLFGLDGTSLFPSENPINPVTNMVFEGIELINNGQDELLKNSIQDRDYLNNFISLAKEIAPDDNKVKSVGFLSKYEGTTKKIIFRRQRNDIHSFGGADMPDLGIRDIFQVEGTLKIGDGEHNMIKVHGKRIDTNETFNNKVKVTDAIGDIVRMYFEKEVRLRVERISPKEFDLIELL